jgi:hypothetical protein
MPSTEAVTSSVVAENSCIAFTISSISAAVS